MSPDLETGLRLLAGLSEGQRPLAHMAVLLGLVAGAAAVILVRLVRRRARRTGETSELRRPPEQR